MEKYFNYCQYIRDFIYNIYKECKKKSSNAFELLYLKINKLKNTNFDLYMQIISILFTDYYRFINLKNQYNSDNDTELEEKLLWYEQIEDKDDLNQLTNENNYLLIDMLKVHIICMEEKDMNTKRSKATLLNTSIPNHFNNINPLDKLEKMIFFRNYNIDELLKIYTDFIDDRVKNGTPLLCCHDQAIELVIEQLHILEIGNEHCFIDLMIEICKGYFVLKSRLQSIDIIDPIDEKILDRIKEQDLLEFIDNIDDDELVVILEGYLDLKFNNLEEQLSLDNICEKLDPLLREKIKKKFI